MDASVPDGGNRQFAGRASRRVALRGVLGGIALGISSRAFAQEVTPSPVLGDWESVEALARDAETTGGVIGIGVRGAAGELFAWNPERRFRAASTIKVPILIDAYRQIDTGTLSLEDLYRVREQDRVPGSGVLAHLHLGLEFTFADLLYLMIAVSDNTATNLVIDRLGFDSINVTMRSLGMTESVLGRKMLGRLPEEGDPENWATPHDFALAVQAIIDGDAAKPESCARMLETMEQQQEMRRISRFLPEAPDIRWGSKPGDLPSVVNDVGFVSTERGTMSIAIFCENLPNLDEAERAIGAISREALGVVGIVPLSSDPSGSSWRPVGEDAVLGPQGQRSGRR